MCPYKHYINWTVVKVSFSLKYYCRGASGRESSYLPKKRGVDMGNVHRLDFKEKVYEYENCSGCNKEVDDQQEEYMEIVMPYEDHDKHILLCESCYQSAKSYGIF